MKRSILSIIIILILALIISLYFNLQTPKISYVTNQSNIPCFGGKSEGFVLKDIFIQQGSPAFYNLCLTELDKRGIDNSNYSCSIVAVDFQEFIASGVIGGGKARVNLECDCRPKIN